MDTITNPISFPANVQEFENYWLGIKDKLCEVNLNPDTTIGGFRISRMIELIENRRRCCKEMYNTILFRASEIHNDALYYAEQYGIIKDYPFKDNWNTILPYYITIMED